MTGQETRNKLTDYWQQNGIEKGNGFALLTNIIYEEWTGLSVKKHKDLKGLKSQNLRDHMNEAELIFYGFGRIIYPANSRNRSGKRLTRKYPSG